MAGPDKPPPPGLPQERTALAWDRTGVGFILVGLLFLRATGGMPPAWRVASFAVVGFGSFLMLYAYRRYTRASTTVTAAGGSGLLPVVGLATIALSLASAALIVLRAG